MRISDWSSDVCSSDLLTLRASIAVALRLPFEAAFAHHAGLGRGRVTVTGHPHDLPIFQPLGDTGGGVARVKAYGCHIELKAFALAVEPAQIDDRIVHVRRCGVGVGDRQSTRLNSSH